ncbi:hypothetical protein [Nostoc sp. FACHB-133]|uniref:hypothetical protein n=1 Tax=Nostoc sp. FACHB-133 TaxID=2692835 RepID=UPI00168794F5|nr:hypothetical protein [Nostoc sp. FACHB-133]MBD2523748.1 hypothetical protein [Nostoc sp. FACHB-133]
MSFIEEEFRIQEPESRIDSVLPDKESRFKTPDFKTLVRGACRRQDSLTLRYLGEEKILSLLKPLT